MNFDASETNFDAPKLDFDAPELDFDAPKSDFDAPKSAFDASKTVSEASRSSFGALASRLEAPSARPLRPVPSTPTGSAIEIRDPVRPRRSRADRARLLPAWPFARVRTLRASESMGTSAPNCPG